MSSEPKSPSGLLQGWDRRALKAVDAHYESARFYVRTNTAIGIPTVILAAVICTLAFATVGKTVALWVQMAIGFLALIQAVLAALHTWLRHSELAEKHRQAGARYAAIRRYIEQLRTFGATVTSEMVTQIRESLDTVAREAPSIPPRIWHRTQLAYKGHGTADGKVLSPDQKVT